MKARSASANGSAQKRFGAPVVDYQVALGCEALYWRGQLNADAGQVGVLVAYLEEVRDRVVWGWAERRVDVEELCRESTCGQQLSVCTAQLPQIALPVGAAARRLTKASLAFQPSSLRRKAITV